jgi:hypothetical protein
MKKSGKYLIDALMSLTYRMSLVYNSKFKIVEILKVRRACG